MLIFQVLQYNATADKWTLVDKMQFRRYDLVVVEANLGDDCATLGNLYPGKKRSNNYKFTWSTLL